MIVSMRFFGACLAGGILLLFATVAFAQTPRYTVAPFVIDKELRERDIVTETITITNNSASVVEVFPIVTGVSVGPEGGIEEFVPASMSDRTTSLTSWLQISRQVIRVPVGESREAQLTFKVNPSAKPGTYHAFIGFARGTTQTEAERFVRSGQAPGVVINVTIKSDTYEVLRLSRFLISKFILNPGPDDIKFEVDNPGETSITPEGDILIYNSKGEEVGFVPINPDKTQIEPGQKHTFTAPIPTGGLLGKYKAFMSMRYGNDQVATVNDTTFFYVLPWMQLLIVFGILAIGSVTVSLVMHRRYLTPEDEEDYDMVPVSLRGTDSDPKHHDLDLKQGKEKDDW